MRIFYPVFGHAQFIPGFVSSETDDDLRSLKIPLDCLLQSSDPIALIVLVSFPGRP